MQYCERKRGEIYCFTNPQPNEEHPFAIIGRIDEFNYLGCMITHGSPVDWVDNQPMKKDYFEERDSIGEPYRVVHSVDKQGIQSHFMKVGLKKGIDLDVKLAGMLTAKGLEYLTNVIRLTAPEDWKEYKRYAVAQKKHRQHIMVKQRREKK